MRALAREKLKQRPLDGEIGVAHEGPVRLRSSTTRSGAEVRNRDLGGAVGEGVR